MPRFRLSFVAALFGSLFTSCAGGPQSSPPSSAEPSPPARAATAHPSSTEPAAEPSAAPSPSQENTGAASSAQEGAGPASGSDSNPMLGVEAPLAFERVLEARVRSIAFGKSPRAAVLADVPYVFDGQTWARRALPEALQASADGSARVEIFFGRDNQPRLMGTRDGEGGAQPVYLRHFPTGWRKEPKELGPLTRAPGGLYGVLGYADPEVVCAPGAFCLIKRMSGWGRSPADAEARRVFLTARGVYKQSAGQLQQLVGDAWVNVAPLGFEPRSLCTSTSAQLWLAGGEPAALWGSALDGAIALSSVALPNGTPLSVHCADSGAVWVGGSGGLALLTPRGFARVRLELGAVHLVTGRDAELWVATERGLFVGRPSAE